MSWACKFGSGAFSIVFLGAASSGFAFELNQNFYVSGGAGLAQYDLSMNEDLAASDPATTYEDEREPVAFQLVAGWNFMDSISAEFIYVNFGTWESTETELDPVTGDLEAEWYDEGSISGFGFAARYDFAMSGKFDGYARVGLLSWEMDWESENTYVVYDEVRRTTTGFDGVDLLVSLGAKYSISDQLFIFAEVGYLDSDLEKSFGDGDKIDEDFGVQSFFGGVQYYFSPPVRKRFDGSTVESKDERTREVTACDPKYKDISGIMCE